MNEITKMDRSTITPADGRRAKPPSAVLKPYLGPHIGCRRLGPEFVALWQAIGRLNEAHWSADLKTKCHAEAEEAASDLPSDAELERLRAVYADAANGRATRKQIGAITAALLDALPTFDTTKALGYLDALLFALEVEAEVEPFSAQALAGVAFRLMCAETFAPTPDKVLAAVRKEQERYRSRVLTLERTIEDLAQLRKVAA